MSLTTASTTTTPTTLAPGNTTATIAPDGTSDSGVEIPIYAYILIGVGVVVVFILIVVAGKRQKDKKNKEQTINKYRSKEDKRFAAAAAELGEVYAPTDYVKEAEANKYKFTKKKAVKSTG